MGRTAVIEVTKHSVLNHVFQIIPRVALCDNAEPLSNSVVAASSASYASKIISLGLTTSPLNVCIRRLRRIIVHPRP